MMDIIVATKYQLKEYIKSVKIFYLVRALVITFFGVISISESGNFENSIGVEGSTIIFLFILGLNSFRETFLMILQNGSTRKAMFIGRLITILITSVFMAVLDRFIVNVVGLLSDLSVSNLVNGIYESLYEKRAGSLHIVVMNLEAILISIGIYAAVMVAGYFITTAYYRMSKIMKIVVSIGVPISFVILLPVLDSLVFGGRVSVVLGRFFRLVFGGKAGNPYNLLLTCILFIAAGVGLTWLLIRKAVEKN